MSFRKPETDYVYLYGCIRVRERKGAACRAGGEIVREWAILTCQGELLATLWVQNLTYS